MPIVHHGTGFLHSIEGQNGHDANVETVYIILGATDLLGQIINIGDALVKENNCVDCERFAYIHLLCLLNGLEATNDSGARRVCAKEQMRNIACHENGTCKGWSIRKVGNNIVYAAIVQFHQTALEMRMSRHVWLHLVKLATHTLDELIAH